MYICSSCDKEFVKWQGQCESCGEWNCIEEIKIKDNKKSNTLRLVKEWKRNGFRCHANLRKE